MINSIPCIVFADDENVSGCVGKSVENYYNSINDVIESVVNAARNRSEDSRDSCSSCSETKSIGRFWFPIYVCACIYVQTYCLLSIDLLIDLFWQRIFLRKPFDACSVCLHRL